MPMQKTGKLYRDIKRFLYFQASVVIMIILFVVFSALLLLPIYLSAKYYTQQYSTIVFFAIIGVILFFIIKNYVHIYKKYSKKRLFLLHIFVYYYLPVINFLLFLVINIIMFRVFFGVMGFAGALALVICAEIVLIVAFALLRILVNRVKDYLKKITTR